MRFYLIPLLFVVYNSFSQSFSPADIPELRNWTFEDFEWGDYDQDGDLDFLGVRRHSDGIALFRNDGAGHFSQVAVTFPFNHTRVEWVDLDNDNDLDILLAGCISCYYVETGVSILRNDGNDVFSSVTHNLPAAAEVSIADFSSDGNPDVVLYVEETANKFFKNVGNFIFEQVYEIPNRGAEICWVDFNNDGDKDFSLDKILYQNNGDNRFSSIDLGFTNNASTEYTWIDVDTDGDEDFFRTVTSIGSYDPNSGHINSYTYLEVFENVGNSNFQNRGRVDSLGGFSENVVADFDTDGDMDIAASGLRDARFKASTKMLWNQGNWSFTSEPIYNSPEFIFLEGGDHDNDGDFDLMGSGIFLQKTFLLTNQSSSNSAPPQTPSNLGVQTSGQSVVLSWNTSPGPSSLNSYNIFIRKDNKFVITPQADLVSGWPHVPVVANNGKLNQRTVNLADLSEGYYNWSVQAVSPALNHSIFSTEGEFTIYKNNSNSAPGGLVVKNVSVSTVSLEWTDQTSDESGYLVERSEISGNGTFVTIATLGANAQSFTDVNLKSNHVYYYRVRAQRPEVSLSAVVRAKTLPYLQDKPFELTATSPAAGQVLLNWDYDGSDHQGFIIYRSADNKENFAAADTVSVGLLSFTDLGLDGHRNYFYRVAAFHLSGNSDYSNIASVTTPMKSFAQEIIASLDPLKGETSMSWGDYDNDGFDDLFLSNQTQLFKNDGDGSFTKIENTGISFKATSYFRSTSAWGDYDSDGFLDILISNSAGENILYRSNGDGTFESVICSISLNAHETAHITWVDMDNDGDLDVILSSYDSNILAYYRYDGNNTFTIIDFPRFESNSLRNNCVAVSDFDGNGYTDIFAGNVGKDGLMKNNYPAGLTLVSDSRVITDSDIPCCPVTTPYAVWSDFNNDLIPDLTVINVEHYDFLYAGGPSGLDSAYTFTGEAGLASPFVFWEDFDNDGDVDLFNFMSYYGSRIFENLGSGVLKERRSGVLYDQLGSYYSLSWVDYDNDGFRDLISLTSDVPNSAYKNVSNGNKWLKIRLVGDASNSKGVGAKIYLKSNGAWQRKDVTSNHSHQIQQGFETIFGLRQANTVDSIRVEWPSGARQTLTAVAPEQTIIIRESDAQIKPLYKPSNLYGTVHPFTTIKLFWQDNSHDEDGFKIQRSLDGINFQDLATVGADAKEFLVNNLQAGASYYFRVRAYKGAIYSDWTNIYEGKITLFNNVNVGVLTTWELSSSGGSWSDFSGDGMADLFVISNEPTGDALYTSAGTGFFNQPTPLRTYLNYSRSGAWGDFNNDGNSDLFVAVGGNILGSAEDLHDKLYKNNGGGQMLNLSTDPAATDGLGSQVGAWGDLNKDGFIDLLVSTDLQMLKYNNNQGLTFEPSDNGGVDYPATLVTLSDFDNDNDLDLFTVQQYENLEIWENTGGEFRTRYTHTMFTRTNGFCLDDFDEDGDFDMITAGQGALFYRFDSFEKVFKEENILVTDASGGYSSCTAADFDNNGHLDVLLTKGSTGSVFYLNEGLGVFRKHTGEEIENLSGIGSVASSDYDRDGDVDLFVCDPYYPSKNYVMVANSTINNWCQVKLVGHASNRDGIGAKIKIMYANKEQLREVRTNTGSYSGNEQLAHFGLGSATTMNFIKVEWPSGHVQWMANPAINTLLTIEEGEGDAAPPPPAAPSDLQAILNANISVGLAWQDHSESETSFVIERSINGSDYQQIARVPSGTTSYTDSYFRETQHPELNASYRVAAAVDNVYSAYSNEAFIVVPITGIEDASYGIDVYPNPAKEMLRIRSNVPVNEIKIFDTRGLVVYQASARQGENELSINTTSFPNGIFVVQIRNGDTITYHKIMVRK